MNKRLFIAIPLSKEWLDDFGDFQKRCDKETKELLNFRWTKINNLHITICFLGWIGEEKISEISQGLKKVSENTKPFELEFDNIIFAPPKTTEKMIWAVFKNNRAYQKLVKSVNEAMQIKKGREPIVHITLARFTDRNVSMHKEMLKLFLTKDKILKVDSIQLMESKLLSAGSTYSTIKNFILK